MLCIIYLPSLLLLCLDLDAIGKPPSGLAGGNLMWLGSYVVCQNISDAQYCLASKLDLEVTAKKVNSLFNAYKGLHFFFIGHLYRV